MVTSKIRVINKQRFKIGNKIGFRRDVLLL